MKKRIRSLVFTLAAVALLALLPKSSVLTARADGPETYSVAYVQGTYNEWRYQPGAAFDEAKGHGPLSELALKLKDGDSVVVYKYSDPAKELDLGSVKLESLTVHQGVTAIVHTGGVKNCYVLAGAYTAVNGDVTTAHIYDAATCTFNNNVRDMYLYLSRDPDSNISCGGTVGYFNASYADNGDYFAAFYDIKAGQTIFKDGSFSVPSWAYSSNPSDAYQQSKTEAETGTAQTPPSTDKKPSDDEYDKVPKTGDSNPVFWLFLTAAACFWGSLLLWKERRCK